MRSLMGQTKQHGSSSEREVQARFQQRVKPLCFISLQKIRDSAQQSYHKRYLIRKYSLPVNPVVQCHPADRSKTRVYWWYHELDKGVAPAVLRLASAQL